MKLNKAHFDAQMKDERTQLAQLRQQIAAMQAKQTVAEEVTEDVTEDEAAT